MTLIAQTSLAAQLIYDWSTGELRWVVSKGRLCKKGQRAGWVHHNGYREVCINGKRYQESILIWFYVTGSWPEYEIDHINGIPTDNRWLNLRLATRQLQIANSKCHANHSVGLKGVANTPKMRKETPSFRARICVNSRSIHLGYFHTAEKAHAAYFAAAKKYFGEFARV